SAFSVPSQKESFFRNSAPHRSTFFPELSHQPPGFFSSFRCFPLPAPPAFFLPGFPVRSYSPPFSLYRLPGFLPVPLLPDSPSRKIPSVLPKSLQGPDPDSHIFSQSKDLQWRYRGNP